MNFKENAIVQENELMQEVASAETNQIPDHLEVGDLTAEDFITEIGKEFTKVEKKFGKEKPKPDRFANVEPFDEDEMANAMDLINDDILEIPKLVSPILQKVGLAGFIGSSDVGKSAFCRYLAICVITGRKFLGWEVTPKHKRVIYCSTEDDKSSISYLIKKQNKDFQLSAEEFKNLTFIFSTHDLVNRLDKMLSENPVDLIIIDAFADIFNMELYKATEVRQFLQQYHEIALRYGCLVLFLHHTKKASENADPSKNNSLGSQGIEAKLRFMAEIRSNKANPSTKHFCIVKGNYLPHEFKTHSFDMTFTPNLTFESMGTRTHFDKLNSAEVSIEGLESEYNNIILLQDQGLGLREIGLKLGVSHSSITRKIKRYEKLKESSLKENN